VPERSSEVEQSGIGFFKITDRDIQNRVADVHAKIATIKKRNCIAPDTSKLTLGYPKRPKGL
jgi:hypothetical protein